MNAKNTWHNIYITDKTGMEHFKTLASPMSTMSELRNLQRHLEQAKQRPMAYTFLDVATAVIMLDGLPYGVPVSGLDADAMLKELGL